MRSLFPFSSINFRDNSLQICTEIHEGIVGTEMREEFSKGNYFRSGADP